MSNFWQYLCIGIIVLSSVLAFPQGFINPPSDAKSNTCLRVCASPFFGLLQETISVANSSEVYKVVFAYGGFLGAPVYDISV